MALENGPQTKKYDTWSPTSIRHGNAIFLQNIFIGPLPLLAFDDIFILPRLDYHNALCLGLYFINLYEVI